MTTTEIFSLIRNVTTKRELDRLAPDVFVLNDPELTVEWEKRYKELESRPELIMKK